MPLAVVQEMGVLSFLRSFLTRSLWMMELVAPESNMILISLVWILPKLVRSVANVIGDVLTRVVCGSLLLSRF